MGLHQMATDGGVEIILIRGDDDGGGGLLQLPKLREKRQRNVANGQLAEQERTSKRTHQTANIVHMGIIVAVRPRGWTNAHQVRILVVALRTAQAGNLRSHSIETIL